MSSSSSKIGITLGDPSGVGPELVATFLAQCSDEVRERLIVFADAVILDRAFIQATGRRLPDTYPVLDRGMLSADQAVPGRPSEAGAKAQIAYLEAAVNSAKAGKIEAIVTAPIAKAHCRRNGFEFPGQTEFFAERFGVKDVVMMFAGPALRVALATTHIPLSAVPTALSIDGITKTAAIATHSLREDFGIAKPRVGVLGLNPHAGEDGELGPEEISIIEPAVARLREELPEASIDGPLVPDAAFRAARDGRYDLMVAMYHDQALIPLKLIDFDLAVNVTAGLPIVRTSPDHGVAYDIAGSGSVRTDSFFEAALLAEKMIARRS